MQKRLVTIKTKSVDKIKKLDIRKRHKKLLELEGWYSTDNDEILIDPLLLRKYKESNSKLKISRWLLKNNLITEAESSKLGVLLNTCINFKLSCRHNDLLRLAESKDYTSCFNGNLGLQQLRYLADPDLAIIYVPDKSGKYKWRCLVRLMINPVTNSGHVLLIQRMYGNTNHKLIFKKLNKIIPVFIVDKGKKQDCNNIVKLRSATKHNNKIVKDYIWSDHKIVMDSHNRLVLFSNPFELDMRI